MNLEARWDLCFKSVAENDKQNLTLGMVSATNLTLADSLLHLNGPRAWSFTKMLQTRSMSIQFLTDRSVIVEF